jgi:hypothetical protein
VTQAAARYRQKFGVAPDVCYVNDQMLNRAEVRVAACTYCRYPPCGRITSG